MKIRIKGNTIRIRLSKSEVDRFAVNHRIEDHTEFGDTKFSYALVSGPQYAQMGADFKDGIITMFLTEKQAEEWTKTTLIGLENDMPIGNGKTCMSFWRKISNVLMKLTKIKPINLITL
ncbi:MAG: hypothetical protein IPP51_06430 [Bacteroidetes bacterium]|nr:hypothetical protein [Bacteroidota bacterium]